MTHPRPISGRKKSVAWLNKLRAASLSCRIKSVIGGRLIQNTDGVSLEFGVPPSGGGSALRMHLLIEEADDWNICRSLEIDKDGNRTPGDTNIYIAKPPELRHTIVAELIDGDSLTYAYTNEHERVATIDEGELTEISETQVIVPWYLVWDEDNDGSIIYAAKTSGTGVWRETSTDVFQELTLLEISGREWGRSSTQPAP